MYFSWNVNSGLQNFVEQRTYIGRLNILVIILVKSTFQLLLACTLWPKKINFLHFIYCSFTYFSSSKMSILKNKGGAWLRWIDLLHWFFSYFTTYYNTFLFADMSYNWVRWFNDANQGHAPNQHAPMMLNWIDEKCNITAHW